MFLAVQEQCKVHKDHARQSLRGAQYLLQGLVQCQQGGYAFDGKPVSRKAAKGQARTYASYRCLGTDAYRFGGERVWENTQVRTDLLDLAVWREVCGLLAHPERLAEAYRRRLQAPARATLQEHTTLEGPLGKLRQGLARLIDSYTEGLIAKQEFEPRIARRRQRILHLEAQHHHRIDEAALQTERRLRIGRLEDCAAYVHTGLEAADWPRKRARIRALVQRVDVAHEQVHVVFRVDQLPITPSAEKKFARL